MNNIIIYTIVLIVLVFFGVYASQDTIYVVSIADNNTYAVRKDIPKEMRDENANALANINTNVQKLIAHIQNKYPTLHYVPYLRQKYNDRIISESTDLKYTTYTLNKESIHMCLRSRDTRQKLYDMNLLMYVMLHELAHLCNYDTHGNAIVGHGTEFRDIFEMLVRESISIGVYLHTDYTYSPKEYCGMTLNSSII